ncbi:hypothetical protein D3C81_1942640 [compost metagenome]
MAVDGQVAAGLVAVQVEGIGAGLLHLRVAAAASDAQLRAGFQHPQPGDPQGRVAGLGFGDQAVQLRVAKLAPPLHILRRRALLAALLQGYAAPLLRPVLARRLEVRAQPYAAGQAEQRGAEQQ